MTYFYNVSKGEADKRTFKEIISGYNRFKGVSFVGSFKIIEDYLLEQFDDVELILGLEDAHVKDRLEQVFGDKIARDLDRQSDVFIERLLDDTLRLRFPKRELIHSKLFIVDNDSTYAIIVGSMNLTEKAINNNVEDCVVFEGSVGDAIYEHWVSRYESIYATNTTEFLNRARVQNIWDARRDDKSDSTEVTVSVVLEQKLEDVGNKNIVVISSDMADAKDAHVSEDDPFSKFTENMIRLVAPEGNKRITSPGLERARAQLLSSIKKALSGNVALARQESMTLKSVIDTFKHPLYYDDSTQSVIRDGAPLDSTKVTKEDVENLIAVIETYGDDTTTGAKYRDERPSILNAILHTFTAPLLWKLRQSHPSIRVEPENYSKLMMAILGEAGTGKSTAWRHVLRRLIGEPSEIESRMLPLGNNGMLTNNTRAIFDEYMNSGILTPLYIDDLKANLVSSSKFEDYVKNDIANMKRTKSHGSLIFTTNARDINNDQSVTRRTNYCQINSNLRKREDAGSVIKVNELGAKLNTHIFDRVIVELNERLNNVSDADVDRMLLSSHENGYLVLTHEILGQIFEEFGYGDYFRANAVDDGTYDKSRIETWQPIVLNNLDKFKFIYKSPECTIDMHALFGTMDPGERRKEVQRMIKLLPNHVYTRPPHGNNGILTINIESFDKLFDQPYLQNAYDLHFRDREQNDAMHSIYLENNLTTSEETKAMLNALAENQRLLTEQLAEQNKPKGLWRRLFG